MNKKTIIYCLSVSLMTLSKSYALFGFNNQKKDSPDAKIEKMVKAGFPSAAFGTCTQTDGGVKFDVLMDHHGTLSKTDPALVKVYESAINKKFDKLKECAQKQNPNFTKALTASCEMHKSTVAKSWPKSKELCKMVSDKQNLVQDKNEAINLMKQDYGSSRFACSKEYGKINWSGATAKFKTLNSDPKKSGIFNEYQSITNDHIKALNECTIEKNKNFVAALDESCKKNVPITEWGKATRLCKKASDIMNDVGKTADAKAQAAIDDKLFPGILGKVGCTKAVADPFNPAELADYVKRQLNALEAKDVSAQAKTQASKNSKRADEYVNRLGKCAVQEADVNFNKILSAKFGEADKQCKLESLQQYQKTKIGSLIKKYQALCKAVKKTSVNIGQSQTVAAAKKALGVPSNRLGWVGFPTSVVEKLGSASNFEHLTTWYKLDKDGFDKHFGIILKGVSIGKNGKVANPKSVALLSEGCGTGGLNAFAKQNTMNSITAVCKVAQTAGTEHGRQTTVEDAFNTLKVPSGLMAPAAYQICNEAMTEVWKHEEGIKAIKTILANQDALPRWQKHISGIMSCIGKTDEKTGVTKNSIMASHIVAASDQLTKLDNVNLETLVENAKTIQTRREAYLEKESGVSEVETDNDEAESTEDEDEAEETNAKPAAKEEEAESSDSEDAALTDDNEDKSTEDEAEEEETEPAAEEEETEPAAEEEETEPAAEEEETEPAAEEEEEAEPAAEEEETEPAAEEEETEPAVEEEEAEPAEEEEEAWMQ